jgi:AcrR family transcriptional regulator
MVKADRKIGSSAERLLRVTEELCAEHGLEAVSMRDIAKEANIAVSVIYHHFGSKMDLLKAVLHRRFGELHEVRAPLLAKLEGQSQPDLDNLLYAVIAPLALLRTGGREGEITGQFLARVFLSTLPEIKAEVDAGLGRLGLLVDLAQRVLPQLSREEICWRLHFTFGIEHMTHWDYARLEIMSDGLCNARAVDESISRAVAFAKAAFLAP